MTKSLNKIFKKYNIHMEDDVYEYGLIILKKYLTLLIILFPTSIMFHTLFESLVFIILYFPLKNYIGGFHFKHSSLCTIFSVFFSILIPKIAITINQISNTTHLVCFLFSFILTSTIGTTDTLNKRLSKKEKYIYTKKAIFIEFFYFIFVIILNILSFSTIANIGTFTLLFCTCGIIINKITNNNI